MRAEIWGLTMAIREFGCFASQLCQAWSCISLLLFTEQDAQWTGWTAMNLFSKQNELMRASFQSRINWCSLDWVLSSSQCSAFIFSPLGKDLILSVAWQRLRKWSFEFVVTVLFTLARCFHWIMSKVPHLRLAPCVWLLPKSSWQNTIWRNEQYLNIEWRELLGKSSWGESGKYFARFPHPHKPLDGFQPLFYFVPQSSWLD